MSKIEKRLVGDPVAVGERTIQPVARVSGWHGSGGSDAEGGAGTWLRVTPVEVMVRESDGTSYHVPVVNGTRQAMRGMILVALAVAGICWLLMRALRKEATKKKGGREG